VLHRRRAERWLVVLLAAMLDEIGVCCAIPVWPWIIADPENGCGYEDLAHLVLMPQSP